MGPPSFHCPERQPADQLVLGHEARDEQPAWALTDDALVSVAELLRRFHQAVSTFEPTPHIWPASPPAAFTGELVSHNDVNLDNVVFRGGRAVALIDFDLASPGSRLWDVACAARLWVPLRPDRYIGDARRGRVLERLRLFVDSYGLPDRDRARIVDAVAHNHTWCYDLVATSAARGHPAFATQWDAAQRVRADRSYRWVVENERRLQAVVDHPRITTCRGTSAAHQGLTHRQ